MEPIGPGISRAKHSNDQIIEYKIAAIDASTLETWSADVLNVLEHWPKPRPLGIIYDLSEHGVGIPYLSLTRGNIYNLAVLRHREPQLIEILDAHQTFQIFFALVLSDTSLGNYMLTKSRTPPPDSQRIVHKVFFSSEAGLQWVLTSLRAKEKSGGTNFG